MNSTKFDSDFFPELGDSLKWSKYRDKDVIAMWLADTDFPINEPILSSIKMRLENPRFGYGVPPDNLKEVICQHCLSRYQWEIEPDWITFTPGVTKGLNIVRAMTIDIKRRQCGLTYTPVYPRLMTSVPSIPFINYQLPLKLSSSKWRMDFSYFNTNSFSDVGVFFLCNPHNPVGRVYSREELEKIANICISNDWLICSDEAHCDLTLNNNKHIPIASISPDISDRTITLMSPGKTFNISGLEFSFSIIENENLRKSYRSVCDGLVGDPNLLSYHAAFAAYSCSEPWITNQKMILERNALQVFNHINSIPGLSMQSIEATFLAWIDVSNLSSPNPQRLFEKHGVGLTEGAIFGSNDFVRLNFACSKDLLDKALSRIEEACDEGLM